MIEVTVALRDQLKTFVDDVIALAGADAGSVWLVQAGRMVPISFSGHRSKVLAHAIPNGFQITPGLFDTLVVSTDDLDADEQTRIAAHLGADAREIGFTARFMLDHSARHIGIVPIGWKGLLVGWVGVSKSDETPFDADVWPYLEKLADQLAVDLDNRVQYKRARERIATLESFHESSTLIAAQEELAEVLTLVADTAPKLCDGTHGGILLWDPETSELYGAAASRGHGRAVRAARVHIDEDSDLCVAIRERRLVVNEDVRSEECTRPEGTCLACNLGMKSFVCAPLLSATEPVGVLIVSDKRRRRGFTEHQRAALETLADQAAAAIRHAQIRSTLRTSRRNLHTLSDQLVEAHEEERRRVSREIHDVVVQGLAALGLEMGMADSAMVERDAERVHTHCTRAVQLLDETHGVVRKLSDELRPRVLDELGLVAAVDWHCRELGERTDLQIHVEADADLTTTTQQATAIYRVLQESLTNVVRHASAQTVWVELGPCDRNLCLTVRDDGRGFDPDRTTDRQRPGIGLLGMAERARQLLGSLDVTSTSKGTQVKFEVPR